MERLARLLSSTYTKIAFGALLGFGAIIGGLYTGYAWIRAEPTSSPTAQVAPNSYEPWVDFGPGDLFPYEEYVDEAGVTGNFESLLRDKESLIFCVSLDCEPCFELLKLWQTHLQARLLSDVQTLYLIPGPKRAIAPEYLGLIKHGRVIFHDQELWKNKYHHVMWPTIVGVDRSGFVTHVQLGFEGSLDHQLVRRFLRSADAFSR